jgi:hypothetical protein
MILIGVTKAKRNTVLFRKTYDHRLGKEIFIKLNPQTRLLREAYPKLRKDGSAMSIADIYIKIPYETGYQEGKAYHTSRNGSRCCYCCNLHKAGIRHLFAGSRTAGTFKDS